MYRITLFGENDCIVLQSESRRIARDIALTAEQSKVGCEVTVEAKPRVVTFKAVEEAKANGNGTEAPQGEQGETALGEGTEPANPPGTHKRKRKT